MLDWFLNTGGAAWVTTLDPATVADEMSVSDIQLINANLVRIDPASLAPEPDLATWRTSPDRKVWIFTIRPNARFSNGDPVTAADAAWSLTRALLPATRSAVAITYLGHIFGAADVATGKSTILDGVRVLSTLILRITLDSPISYFLPALSLPTGDVLDRRVLRGKVADDYLTNTCSSNVGAGPFRLVCVNKGTGRSSFYARRKPPALNLQPNPFYYGLKPRIRIHLPFISSAQTAWRQYQHGRLDGVPVPDSHLAAARHTPGFLQARLLQTDSITPNLAAPPFNNINCRLALAYAVNREDLTRNVLKGTEEPLYGVVPPGLPGYLPAERDIPGYNPRTARAYLTHCPGHLKGVTLTYDSANPIVSREYRAIQAELRAVGADIDLRPLGSHAWLNLYSQPLSAEKPQISLLQFLWIADYPDPQDWCDTLLHTQGNFNLGGFSNAAYDHLIDEATQEPKPARRAQLYQQAQRIALRNGAWIPIGSGLAAYLLNPQVQGMTAAFNGIHPNKDDWSQVSISG